MNKLTLCVGLTVLAISCGNPSKNTPEFVDKYVFESMRERELVYVNRTIYDGPISPSSDELDGGRFWSMQEIRETMGMGVLTPNFESEYQRFFAKKNE